MSQAKKREGSEDPPPPKEPSQNGLARLVAARGDLEQQRTGRVRTDKELQNSLSMLQRFKMRRYLSRYGKMNNQQQDVAQGEIAMSLTQTDAQASIYAERGLDQFIPEVRQEGDYWDLIARTVSQVR